MPPCWPPALAFAQSDDPGILTRFLQDNLSDAGRQVTITGFQGALSSRATVREMTIADSQGVWLTLRGVTLDWNRAAVLRRQFSVNELSADEVIMVRPPVSEPSCPRPRPRAFLCRNCRFRSISARSRPSRVELGPEVLGQAVEASLSASMRLANGEGEAALSLLRLGRRTRGARHAGCELFQH